MTLTTGLRAPHSPYKFGDPLTFLVATIFCPHLVIWWPSHKETLMWVLFTVQECLDRFAFLLFTLVHYPYPTLTPMLFRWWTCHQASAEAWQWAVRLNQVYWSSETSKINNEDWETLFLWILLKLVMLQQFNPLKNPFVHVSFTFPSPHYSTADEYRELSGSKSEPSVLSVKQVNDVNG